MSNHDVDGMQRDAAATLVRLHGTTFAEEADIQLRDEPDELWQLLVLTQLLSNRIRADAAIKSAHELWKIGCRSVGGARATSWQQRVNALGRGGYRRYDFSTSTRLGENTELLQQRFGGDLRQLREAVEDDPKETAALLQEFSGIGPSGASIFLREVQAVWPAVRPYVDKLVIKGAQKAKLPTETEALAALVEPQEFARLAAALVRVARGAPMPLKLRE